MFPYRSGKGICEFLEYYILIVLKEKWATKDDVIKVIEDKSSENTQYRPGSCLRVAGGEIEKAR